MSKVRAAALFLAIGGANAGACTPADSCPKLSDGLYCPVNDVTEHADINRDVAEISKLLKENPINYAQAKVVYASGKFSSKGGNSMRTLQAMAQKDMTASGKYTNAFYSGALDLYGSINAIWHDWMIACLDGTGPCAGKSDDFRKYVINKGCIGIVTAYATYEMGAARWMAANGERTDAKAGFAWDEAAAFHIGNIAPGSGDGYTGPAPGNLYSPYEFNWKRDRDFPTGISTHTEAVPILNYGLKAIRANVYFSASVLEAERAMYKLYSIAAIRSAIKYGWKAYGDGTFSDNYLAEGSIYWRSASGYLSTINKTAVQEVDAIFDLGRTTFTESDACRVKTLVESLYNGLGVTCAMVGTWKDAPANGCLASNCGSTGKTLLRGDSTYVDMCKAPPNQPVGAAAGARVAYAAVAAAFAALFSA